MQRGDGSTLYGYDFPYEINALGLTPDKIEQLYKRLILPRFRAFHPTGGVMVQVNSDASQGVAVQRVVDGAGRVWDFESAPWATAGGGRERVVATLVDAWCVQYQIVPDKPHDSLGVTEACIAGIQADRATLDEIGIPGLVGEDPDSPMRSWDQLLIKCKGDAEELRADKKRPPAAKQ